MRNFNLSLSVAFSGKGALEEEEEDVEEVGEPGGEVSVRRKIGGMKARYERLPPAWILCVVGMSGREVAKPSRVNGLIIEMRGIIRDMVFLLDFLSDYTERGYGELERL